MSRYGNASGDDGDNPSKSGDGVEDLLSWFELHRSLINATADILKDDINIVKKRKITPHTTILKAKKRTAAIVLSKSIIIGFHDAISKAVKDLENLGSQMYEELRVTFRLPEDWLHSGSLASSVAGCEINGPTFTQKIAESPSRLPVFPNDDSNMNDEEAMEPNADVSDPKTPNLQVTSQNKIALVEDEISSDTNHPNPDVIPASDNDNDLTPEAHDDVAQEACSPRRNLDEEELEESQTTDSPTTPSTSFAGCPTANGIPVTPHKSDDCSVSSSDGTAGKNSISPTRYNLLSVAQVTVTPQKKTKKLKGRHESGSAQVPAAGAKDESSVAIMQINKEPPELTEGLEDRELPCSESTTEKEASDTSISNQYQLPDAFRVNNINLSADIDGSQTVGLTRTPPKPMTTPIKVSNDEVEAGEVEKETTVKTPLAEVEPLVSDGEDNNPDSLSQSLAIAHGGDTFDQVTDPSGTENTNQSDTTSTEKDKNKTSMSKSERDAMKDVLGSSSESDVDSREARKSRNDKVTVNDKNATAISSESIRNDSKLMEGVAVVVVEKLAPCIEKALANEGYVWLKHFNNMTKRGGQASDSSDSNSNSEGEGKSDDSLQNYRTELKNLQRSSILRSASYNEKRGGQPKGSRKTKHAKRKDDQILDSGSGSESRLSEDDDDSDSDSDDLMMNSKRTANNGDVDSCSGSEDLEHGSDGNESSRKTRSQSAATTNQQKKDVNKKKYYVAVSSSDSERDNMKAVLGSESASETSRKPRKTPFSDSDSDKVDKRNRKRRRGKSGSSCEIISSDSDSDFKTSKKKMKKRRRVVTIASDSSNKSDSDDSDVQEISQDEEASPSQKGRKNIRKIMSSKELKLTTREAEKKEEERRKRVADRQNLFNGIHKVPETDKLDRLVLDVDPETKESCIEVDTSIVKKLKPHQAEGIKFMYNACFESVEMIRENKTPGGCILAHCMGLGKTLQTVAFLHTLITNEICGIKTALVICPLSTVNNWCNEIRHWTEDCKDVRIHRIFEAKNTINDRKDYLRGWQRRGGIGIIHYDIFRRLVDPKGKSKMKESDRIVFKELLLDPGPDIVVCDEGHLLKNCKSMLSLAVNNIKTLRRIVLTGTPLQNNLTEYHTMMSFVKPSLLGSLQEFTNRFANPIKNGQHADSTDNDVKTMKRRAHVLHRKLEGCVQRCDYSILAPYLPPKYEYIINIKLSERQEQLYKYYLEHVVDPNPLVRRKHLLQYYSELVKVWSHPIALTMRKEKTKDEDDETSEDDSLKDFIVDESTSGSEKGLNGDKNQPKSKTRAQTAKDPESGHSNQEAPELGFTGKWWSTIFKSKSEMYDIDISGKLLVLQEILKTCESIGDKVLVFSQFLTSLNIIEEFLAGWDKEAEKRQKEENPVVTFPLTAIGGNEGRWRHNVEYFRIDGQRKVSDRQRDCEKFNKKSYSKAKLFLISTRAGGLGINLFGANRVVIFDASWNPSQDMQSIFRVYRFGQDKPCYIYRLISRGTMEEKILRRQITKLSLSSRVVDEHQIERHFKFDDINEMYRYDEEDPNSQEQVLAVPKDRLLADLLMTHKNLIRGYEEFDSLLENKPDEGLSNEEKELAWEEYRRENEHQRRVIVPPQESDTTILKLREKFVTLHPYATREQIDVATSTSLQVIRKIQEWMLIQNQLPNNDTKSELNQYVDPLKAWLRDAIGERPEGVLPVVLPPDQYLTRPLPPIFHFPARIQNLPLHIQAQLGQIMPPCPRTYNNACMFPQSQGTLRQQLQTNFVRPMAATRFQNPFPP